MQASCKVFEAVSPLAMKKHQEQADGIPSESV